MTNSKAPSSPTHLPTLLTLFRPSLSPYESFYHDLHSHPSLLTKESRTAAAATLHRFLQHHLPPIGGHGLVAILRNGPGKTILLRSELDALPILEQTHLPYASKVRMRDAWGPSQLLLSAKNAWSSTLVLVFQPNEEYLGGAQAMLDDGLYDKIPMPDLVLAQHVVPLKAGTLGVSAGPVLAAADGIDIRIHSTGPGVNPQDNVDPVLVGARIIVRINDTLAGDAKQLVLECRQFHAGRPGADYRPYADVNVDLKTWDSGVRVKALEEISSIVHAECAEAGITDKPSIKQSVRAPLTQSDPDVVCAVKQTFTANLDAELVEQEPLSLLEDFSLLASGAGQGDAVCVLVVEGDR
ncbi:hypothetical protein EJ04DRAFT_582491 [Polyplosphaeria fusca]|uniref:Uncharacterized protein n=1 Tax=Polyplosphaeria fusca TaxID=682080 RepID=A0A9P4QL53_9PLEO|nr:hypothetical protein EJ04DRAFT_582491 [Polyplosphaeria fusca]